MNACLTRAFYRNKRKGNLSRNRHGNFSNRILPLALTVFSLVALAAIPLSAEETTSAGSPGNIDNRWRPWIGTWKLNSYINFTANTDLNKSYSLHISPNEQGDGVILEAFQEDKALFEDSVRADGISRPLQDEKCTGSYSYAWSDTGKRLIFKSESNCPDTDVRKVSGLSILKGSGEWLDIQLIQSPEERIITIRRYKRTGGQTKPEDVDLLTKSDSPLTQKYGFTIDEIIELSDKIAPEILEAAVLEYRAPFTINASTLERLADANVSTGVIDLMVALTFPSEFIIERDTVSLVERTSSNSSEPDAVYALPPRIYYSIVDPYFPWYWTPYTYSLYWNHGWSVWPNYYYYPYPPGSGGYPGDVVRRDSGKLIAGRGYTQVHPNDGSYVPARYAVERGSGQTSYPTYSGSTGSNAGASRSGSYSGGAAAAGGSAAAAPSYSGGGGGGYSGGSSGGSSGGYSGGGGGGGGGASASPGGYSSGGSGGSGGHAGAR